MASMMNSSQIGRKVNQKCAFAQAILNLPVEHFQDFVGQALVEAVYLEMELAFCLHVAEELSRFGHSPAKSGDAIDRIWLKQQLQSSSTAGVLLETRRLLSQKISWLARLLDVCDSARAVPDGEKSLKSALFADEESDTSSAGLIKTVTQPEAGGKLDQAEAQSALQALLEFIDRHRSSDEEY